MCFHERACVRVCGSVSEYIRLEKTRGWGHQSLRSHVHTNLHSFLYLLQLANVPIKSTEKPHAEVEKPYRPVWSAECLLIRK